MHRSWTALFILAPLLAGCSADDSEGAGNESTSDQDPGATLANGDGDASSGDGDASNGDGDASSGDGDASSGAPPGGAPVGARALGSSSGDGTGCELGVLVDACGVCGGDGASCGCTEGWCADIVFEHNEVRRQLNLGTYLEQPRAQPPMAMVGWDPLIADKAQEHASSLSHWSDGHSSGDFRRYQSSHHDGYHGENMAIGSGSYGDPAYFVAEGWAASEAVGCTLQACGGHYTQIAWRESEWIGCGSKENVPFSNGSGAATVCQYGPGGNIGGRAPY